MKKLQKIMNEISEWSDKTFGEAQRVDGMAAHLDREVAELRAAIYMYLTDGEERLPEVTNEISDCMMLLLDICSHVGISSKDLLLEVMKKLDINKSRRWGKVQSDGTIEHIK